MYIAFCDICADGFATLAQFEGIYSNLVGKPITDVKEYAGGLGCGGDTVGYFDVDSNRTWFDFLNQSINSCAVLF